MASRSFKPSYLASAAQATPCRSPRPGFSRTNSSSSNISTKSDDSLAAVLKGLTTADKEAGESEARTAVHSIPTSNPSTTPGRKRSQPIAIELPSRVPTVYTPLTGRGDLVGGYFPNHEDSSTVTKIYQPHPFHTNTFANSSAHPDSPVMSASSSLQPSPSTILPNMAGHIYTPIGAPMSPTMPEALMIPMGKYHPSNYKSPAPTSVSTPTSTPRAAFLPPTTLSIPASAKRGQERPRHERKTSDVKRKLQQYQRDMIVQAKVAASNSTGQQLRTKEPTSPRLLPAGSPGPITPFELEGESDGYIIAGNRARGSSFIESSLDREEKVLQSRKERVPAHRA